MIYELNTIQHSLITLLSVNGNIEEFKKELPYTLLPDSLRFYLGNRQYTHFEYTPKKDDYSWFDFSKIENLNKENIQNCNKYIVPNIKKCVIGEETNIEGFKEHNKDLNPFYFKCIEKHLVEDFIFDNFIRKLFDCSERYNDKFYYNNLVEISGIELRSFINTMEQEGIYLLSKEIYEKYNILITNSWLEENIKKILDNTYPKELSENTFKYMKINNEIEELIKNKQFNSKLIGNVDAQLYLEMYKEVLTKLQYI